MLKADKSKWEKLESRTLSAIPTLSGRLVYLSSLRDFNTGSYYHAGWTMAGSEKEVDEVLRQVHQELFGVVLDLPLNLLVKDLGQFLREFDSAPNLQRALSAWQETRAYQILPPLGSNPIDRELFVSRFKAALGVLAHQASSSPQTG